jgi:hypothetical protein
MAQDSYGPGILVPGVLQFFPKGPCVGEFGSQPAVLPGGGGQFRSEA